MTKIDQIAQAFAQGVKFAENLKLAMDAAKGKDDEAGHWVTIGEGEEARPVFIKDKKKAAKTESKKAESKETRQKTKKSKTPSATGLLNEKGSALAQLAEREYDKVITSIKDDISSIESDPTFPPEVKRYETVPIKSNLRNIKSKLSDVNKDLSTVKDEVSKAVKDGNFNRQGVESVWRAMKQLKDRAAYVVSHTNSKTAWIGRNNASGMNETADTLNRLSNEASGIRQDANRLKEEVRGSIAQFERENTERTESHTAQSQPRAQRSTSGEAQTVKALEDAYNVSADLIDEMAPKQADRPFLSRLDRIHKDAVALAESAPEISNSHELREMARIMKNADKLVKALPRYYDRNYYGGWVQNIMGKVRAAEEAYTKLKKRKALGPDAAI